MLSFVKRPEELDTDLDKWLYALKHLTEFKERPQYLSGSEFDPLFDLAEYANLNEEERKMYNDSLKYKWDNENVMDYAIKTAAAEADQKATERERAKAEKEKKEIAREMKRDKFPIEKIAKLTKLPLKEIEAL